jgi:hypothetical protein
VSQNQDKYTNMTENGLHEALQSAYKKFHSTETALLCVQDALLRALDNHQAAVLVLLDLSAAFDTVDHDILLTTLETHVGITGKALDWFKSYLSSRYQYVCINGIYSEKKKLKCGVPQGSVLGPDLFAIYSLPLAMLIRKHRIPFHFFADDGQLYIIFDPVDLDGVKVTKEKIEAVIADVSHWLLTHMLMFNGGKTEFLFIHSRYMSLDPFPPLRIGDAIVPTSRSARNLGVIFDECLTMEKQVSTVTQCGFFHLRNISKIKCFLTEESLLIVAHAFITNKLDYCNSLLAGLPDNLTNKLQSVQNATAKMITGKGKYDHNTPELIKLHWLPVKERIVFKVLLVTFKCIHKLAPQYMCDLVKVHTPTRSLRSADLFLLDTPRIDQTTYGGRAFSYVAPLNWNRLPLELRSCQNLTTFKRLLKTHLFHTAFDSS